MADVYYDRLTQMDNSFLVFESEQSAMHVASTQIHEAGPLQRSDGSLDFERIQDYVTTRLDKIPRYRQRLAYTPLEGHPVWIDDPDFNIHYHVRHSRLPRPGDERQLKRMVGRIFGQRLDRTKPLWELWVIEGLEGNRLAVFSKVHHCMVDGVSGAELISTLLTPEPVEKVEPPPVWRPRPSPGALALGASEVARVLQVPLLVGSAMSRLVTDEDHSRHQLAERLRATGRVLSDGLESSNALPFNRPIGPHRRIDWMTVPFDRLRAVRKALGGTINDVVLATAAGAFGRYLSHSRGVDLDTARFRAMTPVSVRASEDKEALGNRVSAWTVELPIAEPDPAVRLQEVRRATEKLKKDKQALGVETIGQIPEWTGAGLLSLGARLMNLGTPFNTVITNVPGPRVPLYLLEAPLTRIHPHVPLVGTMGIGIALFSYRDSFSWGFSADWDLVPDLHDLVHETDRAFGALCDAAGV